MYSCTLFYILGSLLLLLYILRSRTYEGMCLCSGARMPFDLVDRDVDAYDKRVSECGYNTKQFAMVL